MPWRKLKNLPYLSVLAGSWFALALLALLALGVALIGVLTLWRDWLEANWNLTFPTPLTLAFWYLFALVPVGVLLLYFLKLKRRALHVPSTFLWRKSIEDLHVNSLFQWLRKNILLILQLLFLLGLGYALADPTYNSEARGRHIIFMIDNSASMSASDEPPSRLEVAKREVQEQIDALDPSDQAMVIVFNSEAQLLQSYTNSKEALKRAVARIQPTHRPTQLDAALALAEGQANPRRSGEDAAQEQPVPGEQVGRTLLRPEGIATDVYLFSDGRFADVLAFTPGKLNLRLKPIGHSTNNVGIVRMDLRRNEYQPDEFEVGVRVMNFRPEALEARVAVQLDVFVRGEAQPRRQVQTLNLAPRSVRELQGRSDGFKKWEDLPGGSVPEPITTFAIKDPGQGYIRASLRDLQTRDAWKDDFAVDDIAWLAIAPVRRARLLRIGPANDILDAFLKAGVAQRRFRVNTLPVAGFAADPRYREATEAETFDLVIFDRCAPRSMEEMPQANTFFLGAAPPLRPGLWEQMKPMQDLFVREFQTSHRLMRGIETLQGMQVYEARALPRELLPSRASALIETQQEPVMWALGRRRFTDLVLTFPLVIDEGGRSVWNTNWPKQPAGTLPLFLDNVLTQLGRYKEHEEPHRTGMPKVLELDTPVSEVQVTRRDPAGLSKTLKHEPGRDLVFGETDQAGLYEAAWATGASGAAGGEDSHYRFAVNLFDARESNIQPRDDFQVGQERVEKTDQPLQSRRQLWPWFALGALAVLLLEWYVYNRRIHV